MFVESSGCLSLSLSLPPLFLFCYCIFPFPFSYSSLSVCLFHRPLSLFNGRQSAIKSTPTKREKKCDCDCDHSTSSSFIFRSFSPFLYVYSTHKHSHTTFLSLYFSPSHSHLVSSLLVSASPALVSRLSLSLLHIRSFREKRAAKRSCSRQLVTKAAYNFFSGALSKCTLIVTY